MIRTIIDILRRSLYDYLRNIEDGLIGRRPR